MSRLTVVATVAIYTAAGTIGAYAMVTHPPARPVPACSLRLTHMRPCVDRP